MITAKLTAYDAHGEVCFQATRDYPDASLLWEHIGAQQNNHRTVRVHVETDTGLRYQVAFCTWNPHRTYRPSRRFRALLEQWSAETAPLE